MFESERDEGVCALAVVVHVDVDVDTVMSMILESSDDSFHILETASIIINSYLVR